MTTNEKLIVRLAKEFVGAYWNVPYCKDLTVLDVISKEEKKEFTIDKLIKAIGKDLDFAIWIVSYFLMDNWALGFFDNDVAGYIDFFNNDGIGYKRIVTEIDGYDIHIIKINNKYLGITEDDKVVEYKVKIIQVETFEKVA